MKLSTAIVEDNDVTRRYLASELTSWGDARENTLTFKAFSSAEEFLFSLEEDAPYDILLLDIELGNMSGIELGYQLRKKGNRARIIYVTGYTDYVESGFELDATQYLVKPVTRERLWAALDKAADNVLPPEACLVVKTEEGLFKIPHKEILYIEAENVYSVVVTGNETYRLRKPLSKITEEAGKDFFQIHRSFTVNLRRVKRISRTEVVTEGDHSLPLRRGLYEELCRAIRGLNL